MLSRPTQIRSPVRGARLSVATATHARNSNTETRHPIFISFMTSKWYLAETEIATKTAYRALASLLPQNMSVVSWRCRYLANFCALLRSAYDQDRAAIHIPATYTSETKNNVPKIALLWRASQSGR